VAYEEVGVFDVRALRSGLAAQFRGSVEVDDK
jgi:hypothetical protein